jgi:hypothetical protein
MSMPQKFPKTLFKFLLLGLFLAGFQKFFPAAKALSSAQCARDILCLKLVKESNKLAIAKTAIAVSTPPILIAGTAQPVGDAAAPTVVVDSQGRVYYWSNAINQRAQALAQETFCTVYPKDKLCGELFQGGQGDGVLYEIVTKITEPQTGTTTYQGGMVFGPIGGARYYVWNQDFDSAGVLTNPSFVTTGGV